MALTEGLKYVCFTHLGKRHMHKQDDACFPDWMRDISDFILCCYHNIQNALTSTQTKTEYK